MTTFTGDTILAYCVDLPSLDNPFCKQITRDANDPIRSIRSVSTQTINASRMQTRGVDLSVGYQTRFLGGRLNTDLKATYLLKKETQAVPGIDASIVKAMGSFTDPRFHGSLFVNYSRDRWDIAFSGRVIGAAIVNPNLSKEAYDHDKIPAIFYGDLSIGFQPTSKLKLTLGVNNIFDTAPPFNPRTYLGAGGYYDVVGRSYFLSAKTNF